MVVTDRICSNLRASFSGNLTFRSSFLEQLHGSETLALAHLVFLLMAQAAGATVDKYRTLRSQRMFLPEIGMLAGGASCGYHGWVICFTVQRANY